MKYLSDTGLKYLIEKIVARLKALEEAVSALSATSTDSGEDGT